MNRRSIVSVEQSSFSRARKFGVLSLVLTLLFAVGCNSSSDSGGGAVPPPPPPPAGIGPAGGTVNGPGGSSIVVPANALAANTAIAIAQSSAGSPALPSGLEAAGSVFAITPHGTTFAVAATVTVPINPAMVPAGRDVQLVKTNAAQDGWESVPGATESGDAMTATTDTLSWWLTALIATVPTITTPPADQTVDAGQSATFSVVAEQNGGAFLSYQWQKDGVDIPGATSASYTLLSATSGDNGAQFTVIVGNGVGSTSSQAATLTVNAVTGWTRIGGAVFAETVLGVVTPVRYPSVAVAGDGTIYVAYGIRSSGIAGLEGVLRVSRWNGTSWQQLGDDLNDGIGTAPEWPSIKVGSDGVPVVAWVNRTLNATSINEVVVQSWDAASSAWQRLGGAPSGIWSGSTGAYAPLLVLGAGSNQPNVVFSEGICIVYRALIGSVWEPDRLRACAASNQSSFAFALSNNGTALVAGSPSTLPQDGSGNPTELRNWISVRYRAAQDDGFFTSELGGGPANTVIADEIGPAGLSVGNSGEVFLGFVSRSSGAAQTMTVRRWNGATWTTLGGDLLATSPLVSSAPHLRIETALDTPGVAWLTGSSASSTITGRVWNGLAWVDVPAPHPAATNIGHFGMTVGPNNNPYVAYTVRDANQVEAYRGNALYVSTCDNWCVSP
ncbi:MAG: immunoglobulin domain-containing protein [Gammaproteobacteria bacterium]|nr:immunoglobulin domain-containing protein [Gammaproteobacteria bacterium]MDH5213327.1 immunoglobulin domain-containing protein [Gammaproteobacteria bacterium]MDH5500341.1 immunoglobulin domain-containing protein [Gammaproteobacteria bacterium]